MVIGAIEALRYAAGHRDEINGHVAYFVLELVATWST
jgi:hypothetical protein